MSQNIEQTISSCYTFPLDGKTITLGRGPENTIVLNAIGISKYHASIVLSDPPRVIDLGSSYGSTINGTVISDAILYDDTILSFGIMNFNVSIANGQIVFAKQFESIVPKPLSKISTNDELTIGRDTSNIIHLHHPLISRFHCLLLESNKSWRLVDKGSTNGTYLNGKRIQNHTVNESDLIQIGPFRFIIKDGELTPADDAKSITLEARNITVKIKQKKLIDDISLTIKPGEFVAVLGPSGAGKSTLAKALTGQLALCNGGVFYNGFSLQKLGASLNASVGYVSQHNLLRAELSVHETLAEQALLRLPKDSSEIERIESINNILQMLDIKHLKNNKIGSLSGGEAKRIHLGIELLSSPVIIFLDEPLAGLDPGLIHKFMILFRSLCDNGHTVLLTTHTLEQIELCDRVLFISKGRLVYNGDPAKTAKAFGVNTLADAYEEARRGKNTITANERYSTPSEVEELSGDYKRIDRSKSIGIVRQTNMLIYRYIKVLLRDTSNLTLMLVQAPLISFLLYFVFHGDTQYLPMSFFFCVTISAIWVGGVNSVREIAKEWSLFDREFRSGLSSVAYTISKIFTFTFLSAIQAFLFSISLHYLFNSFSISYQTFLIIFITISSGSVLGLAISAFSGNVNRAVSMLPIIFIPQIFFSGILIPFDQMPQFGEYLSHATISRPAFSLFKKIFLLEIPLTELNEFKSLIIINTVLILTMILRVRFYRLFMRKRN